MTPLAAALALAGLAGPVTDVPLAGGDRKAYTFDLRKGDALRGSVQQRGIDVVATVRRPDGTVALEVDSPNGTDGPEPVALVARTAGAYVLEVHALTKEAPAGRFDLVVEPVRRATQADRQVAEALDLHQRAFAARNEALRLQGQGLFERSRARYRQAERGALRALSLRERVLGPGHYDVAATRQVLGLVYDEIGDYAAGERHFARALAILEALMGPGAPGLLTTQSDLGYLRLATGDYGGAEDLFARSLARREELYGAQSERLLAGLGGLAEALWRQGRLERAESVARRVLALREAARQPSPHSQVALGRILVAQGRVKEGEEACASARATLDARPGAHAGLAIPLLCLAEARLAAGDPAGAAPLADEAVRLRESAGGPVHPWVAEALALQGTVRVRRDDARGARAAWTRALEIRQRRLGPAHPAVAETRTLLRGLDM
jgi:tetratricopeptide (TPR) repeat protein